MAARAAAFSLASGHSDHVDMSPSMQQDNDGGAGLREYLLHEYKVGSLPAVAVATIAWWACRAGAHRVADLAYPPSGRHQAEHIRCALGAKGIDSFYVLKLPMWNKVAEQRELMDFPMHLPHEAFAAAYTLDPTRFAMGAVDPEQLPPSYWKHPLVDYNPVPLGFFSDAVPHSHKDSFIAYYWSELISGKRHLICSLRKSDMCTCGCKGLCTLGEIQRAIAWSFNVLATGEYPATGHDQMPFANEIRANQRGFQLAGGARGALCEMRADLLELVTACGFKNWANVANPCFCCHSRRDDLFAFPPSYEVSTWQPRDAKNYNEQVQRCLVELVVNRREQLDLLRSHLEFNSKFGGLAVVRNCAALGLAVGYRLMSVDGPTVDLHDVLHGKLEIPTAGLKMKFFDSKEDFGLNFVCPLFSVIGFSVELLSLDVMHIMDLGVLQYLVGAVFWTLVSNNFARSNSDQAEARRASNMLHLRRRLWAFYKSEDRASHEQGKRTKIGKLTLKQLGPHAKPRLRAKAAETRHLVPLLVQLCRENPGFLGRRPKSMYLTQACSEMLQFYKVMEEEPRNMSAQGLLLLRRHMTRFLTFWKSFGGHLVFKHHMAWHLAERAASHGNPKCYWTYPDEGENRQMGTVAKSLHGGNTFYLTFLQKVLPEVC